MYIFSALIDLVYVTVPEDIDSKINDITTVLGFDSTVSTIYMEVPPMISSIFHSSWFFNLIYKNKQIRKLVLRFFITL